MSIGLNKFYATVFSVKTYDKFVSARLSTSQKIKDKDGNDSYKNSSWDVMFVGKALDGAKKLVDKDRIVVTSGLIEDGNPYDKQGVTIYPKLGKIFEFEKVESQNNYGKVVDDEDDLPI